MAETLVEKGICASCGSALRDGSVYCYNCGGSVLPEPLPPAILKPPTGTQNGRDQNNALEFHDPEPPPVTVPVMPLEVPPPAVEPEDKRTFPEEVAEGKRTFPAARREPRRREKRTVEVEWVERQPRAIGFLVAAIVTALIVAGLIVAAAYLR